ncbi:MAG TPA: nucleotide pyrophosphohydrolase [Candidatus Dojkabacteria bacterium]|nr:nucleotide pyrophosphohydrolase [Candidatus Dojkabacteria bacterium]
MKSNNDNERTIQSIQKDISDFVSKRDWKKHHNPVNLSEAIIVEAGELLQLFLFTTHKVIEKEAKTKSHLRERIEEELADILIYSLELTDHLDMDVSDIITKKLEKSSKKHPAIT